MVSRRLSWLLAACLPAMALAHTPKPCVTAGQAAQMLNKDLCVSTHIYDVVELPDGTRLLDICSPQSPDEKCRLTIVSFREDRDTVGALSQYRNRNVRIRGIVRSTHGRAWMMLSHARQFYGGPPKFRPNPRLARGFNAGQDWPPLYDPNLRAQGGRGASTNTRNQETLPAKK